jgi:integrase
MASLVKPWVVRHLDADGRQVAKGTAGATKVKQRAKKWYGQFTDGDGRRRRVPLCTDKAAARQMLATIEREVQRGRAGLDDGFAGHRKAPIRGHIDGYEEHLRGKGVCDEHRKETLRRLKLVLDHGKVRTLAELRPEVVDRFLALKAEQGVGVSMRNAYLSSCKAFCRWCVLSERLEADPLARLRRSKGEIRRQRRALTENELIALLRAARDRPLLEISTVRSGRNKGEVLAFAGRPDVRARATRLGQERALIYKVLVLTGLRRNELKALEVRNLTLTGRRPCLVLPGRETKNKETADLPLRADLARDLADWIREAGKAGADRVFVVPVNLYRILRRDLELAGIAYKDDRGRTIDVHALRHTTASHLSRGKVSPRVAQGFMRHSDIRLTMQTYTDPRLLDEAEALDALPDLPLGPKSDRRSDEATG